MGKTLRLGIGSKIAASTQLAIVGRHDHVLLAIVGDCRDAAGLLKRLTDLGDPTLLLLGGLGVFFYLWSDDERRALARSWAVAFGLCVFLTIIASSPLS